MNDEKIVFVDRPAKCMPLALAEVGRQEVLNFVKAFYQIVQDDDLLGPVFARIVSADECAAHFETMTDFWSAVVFGGKAFRGDPMRKHAQIHDISAAHFERWLAIFVQVAVQVWPPEIAKLLIYRAQQIAPALLAGAQRAREQQWVSTEDLH